MILVWGLWWMRCRRVPSLVIVVNRMEGFCGWGMVKRTREDCVDMLVVEEMIDARVFLVDWLVKAGTVA
jgi:hypothetical protein